MRRRRDLRPRTARDVERDLQRCDAELMNAPRPSRQFRSLVLRRQALALELALTTGALSMGSL